MFLDTKTQCFIEAAECLNFTKAADRMYISQPALSKNIAKLEEELGMKLFNRDKKLASVELTPAGSVLLCELRKIGGIIDGIPLKAKMAELGQEGHLSIAMRLGHVMDRHEIGTIRYIDENYPGIKIEEVTTGFRQMRDWLSDGTVDIIITYEEDIRNMRGVAYDRIGQVGIGFSVPAGSPLAMRPELRIEDLRDSKILVPYMTESEAFTDRLMDACRLAGFDPDLIYEADLNRINMSVEMGRGIAMTTEDLLSNVSPNVSFFKCAEMGSAQMVMAFRKDNLNPILSFYRTIYHDMRSNK